MVIARQVELALVRDMRVGVERDVGDRVALADERSSAGRSSRTMPVGDATVRGRNAGRFPAVTR